VAAATVPAAVGSDSAAPVDGACPGPLSLVIVLSREEVGGGLWFDPGGDEPGRFTAP